VKLSRPARGGAVSAQLWIGRTGVIPAQCALQPSLPIKVAMRVSRGMTFRALCTSSTWKRLSRLAFWLISDLADRSTERSASKGNENSLEKGGRGMMTPVYRERKVEKENLKETSSEEWRGLWESNSRLNLGKVSSQLQKRRKWRLFRRF